ncbi:MAG TPA: hypothetical protein VKT77_15395 [Chthonomonadaceae bacterium]|nr:hypothetical protein [Chthonomonadaceae bacterium]
MRSDIPLLQNVRVASPCRASWEEMDPVDGDRVRFCAGCRKRVYNLSALCQAEAEGLLREHEGHLCVRYYRRRDGTILTADCPVGLRAARRLVLARTKASFGACLALAAAFAMFWAKRQTDRPTMGGAPAVAEPAMGQRVISEPPPEVMTGAIALKSPDRSAGGNWEEGGPAISPRTREPIRGEDVMGKIACPPPERIGSVEVGEMGAPTRAAK